MNEILRVGILSSGAAHDYPALTGNLSGLLEEHGMDVTVSEEMPFLSSDELQAADVLVFNSALFPQQGTFITPEQQAGLLRFFGQGKGLVAVHAAVINFGQWDEYGRILGARWVWDQSGHADYGAFDVRVIDRAHPINEGLDGFSVEDELYHTLSFHAHVHTLMTALWGERIQPLAWTHEYRASRVYCNLLGHSTATFNHPIFRRQIVWGIQWAAGR